MRAADVVVIAARWQPWAADVFDQSLEAMALPGEVIVVGSKSFEENRRAMLGVDPAHITAARKAPDEWSRESSEALERTVPKGQFVNLVARMCDGGCPLLTDEGALISYDGRHLTPDGAMHLSKFVFDQGPLAPFANRVTDTSRWTEPLSKSPAQTLETDVPMNTKEMK